MDDDTLRSDILRCFLSYIYPNRLLITSTPFKGLSFILESHGHVRVDNLVHYDFGENHPAGTYIIDLRKGKFPSFLDRKMKQAGFSISGVDQYNFTEREQEVAELVLSCKSNEEISQELYISIVTVKKHISSILKKVNVKNRPQFIKKMIGE